MSAWQLEAHLGVLEAHLGVLEAQFSPLDIHQNINF